jgi:hypothetical protein
MGYRRLVTRATLRLKLADALLYGAVLTAVWAAIFLPVSILLGGDLVGVKWGLFMIGILTLGVGSFKLRPGKQWREDEDGLISDSRGESNVQLLVDRLPPLRDAPLRDDQRLSDGAKLLLGALCMLATSFLLEAVLGVGVAVPA